MKEQCESEQFIAINDNMNMVARVFYIKRKMRGREQDSRETEREGVRGRALQGEKDGVSIRKNM